MSIFLRLTVFVVLVSAACGKDESSESKSDLVAGIWESDCVKYLSTEQIDEECGFPTNESCEAKYAKYYAKYSLSTKKIETLEQESPEEEFYLPQISLTTTTYYHDTAATAAKCESDNRVAAETIVRSYDINVSIEDETLLVEESNGFPENSFPIDMTVVSYSRSYFTTAAVDAVNTYSICESNDWEKDVAVNISDKENCSDSAFRLTTRFGEDGMNDLYDPDYADDGNWDSSFKTKDSQFSIYQVDETDDPKNIALGRPHVIVPLETTDEELKTAAEADGRSMATRHNQLGVVMDYVSAEEE